MAAGAVVAVQPHDLRPREVPPELREEAHVRAPEAVDGLVRIADGADVPVRGNELPDEPDLLLVHVLVFVDADPSMALPVLRPERGRGFQRIRRPDDEIVEIAEVAGFHGSLVCLERFARPPVRRRRAGALGVGDGRETAARLPFGDLQRIPEQFEPFGLRCDPEAALQAGRVPVLMEDGEAQGVEGVQRDLLPGVRQQDSQAVAHLAGGPAGEGHGQAAGRRDGMVRHQVREAVGEGPGLPGAGAGHDEQRTADGFDGPALIGVQTGQGVGEKSIGRCPIRAAGAGRRRFRPVLRSIRSGRYVRGAAVRGCAARTPGASRRRFGPLLFRVRPGRRSGGGAVVRRRPARDSGAGWSSFRSGLLDVRSGRQVDRVPVRCRARRRGSLSRQIRPWGIRSTPARG